MCVCCVSNPSFKAIFPIKVFTVFCVEAQFLQIIHFAPHQGLGSSWAPAYFQVFDKLKVASM